MSTQDQIQKRLEFLQAQIDSLEHYLPETYQYLMAELDCQQRDLMELKVQDFYSAQDDDKYHENSDSSDPAQTHITRHRAEGIHD